MSENVFKKVAEQNGVDEQEVRAEIGTALSLAEGFEGTKEQSLDEIVAMLARQVIRAMGDQNYFVEK